MIERFKQDPMPDLGELPSAQAQDGSPVRAQVHRTKKRRSVFGLVARLVLVLLIVAALGVFSVFWLLSRGGISNDQIKAQLEQQLTDLLGGERSAKIGDARFEIGQNGLISVDAQDVTILDNKIINLGVAQSVALKVKLAPLLSGNIEAKSLHLSNASVALFSQTQTGLENDITEGLRPAWPINLNFSDLMRTLGKSLVDGAALLDETGLESIEIKDANLVGYDQLQLGSKRASLKSLVIENRSRSEDSIGFASEIESDLGTWLVSGSWVTGERAGKTLNLRLSGLRLDELFSTQENPGYGNPKSTADIDIIAPFGADDEPQQAIMRVTLNSLKDEKERAQEAEFPVIESAVLNFRVLPLENQITLERSSVRFDRTDMTLVGGLRYPNKQDDEEQSLPAFAINVENFKAFGLVTGDQPPVGSLELTGHIDPLRQLVTATKLQLNTPNGELVGSASLKVDQNTPHLALDIGIPKMPVSEFKQFWPRFIAPDTREWVADGLRGGTIRDAWLKADFPPGSLDDSAAYTKANLSAKVPVYSTSVQTAGKLPRIESANGTVELNGNLTSVALSKGEASLGKFGTIKIGKSSLSLGSFAQKTIPADLNITMSGPARALARLGTLQPLSFTDQLDIDPASLSGSVTGSVNANLRIGKEVTVDKRSWQAKVKLANGAYSKELSGRELSGINVSINAVPGSAEINGTADIDGINSKIALVERFDGGASGDRKITLVLDDADRRRMGFDTGAILTGPISVTISGNAKKGQVVEADLRKAKLDIPWIGWSKGGGIPAKAKFTLHQNKGGSELKGMKLSGTGFSASGSVAVDRAGLKQISLKKVRLNKIDDFALTAVRNKAGFKVSVDAKAYDARALIRSFLSAKNVKAKSGTKVKVTGRVGRLLGFGGESLTNVKFDFEQNGSQIRRAVINAVAAGNSPTIFNLGPAEQGMETRISTSNGGSVLRFLDLYSKIRGGTIRAELVRDASQVFRGTVVATNFTLLGEPRLAQLLQKPKFSEDLQNVNQIANEITKLRSDQAKVDRMQATIEKGKGFLNIKRGRVTGGDASAAFEGRVYDVNNRMNVKGTYLPGRALNRMVAKIPFFGLAFGKGKVNGLLGITFKLSGRYGNPKLQVNPLSIIAPGVFREIFKF